MDNEKLKLVISRRLKSALFDADMTCAELSQLSEVSEKTVYNVIHMRSMPNASTIVMLADTVGCSADWLLGRTDYKGGI